MKLFEIIKDVSRNRIDQEQVCCDADLVINGCF